MEGDEKREIEVIHIHFLIERRNPFRGISFNIIYIDFFNKYHKLLEFFKNKKVTLTEFIQFIHSEENLITCKFERNIFDDNDFQSIHNSLYHKILYSIYTFFKLGGLEKQFNHLIENPTQILSRYKDYLIFESFKKEESLVNNLDARYFSIDSKKIEFEKMKTGIKVEEDLNLLFRSSYCEDRSGLWL